MLNVPGQSPIYCIRGRGLSRDRYIDSNHGNFLRIEPFGRLLPLTLEESCGHFMGEEACSARRSPTTSLLGNHRTPGSALRIEDAPDRTGSSSSSE